MTDNIQKSAPVRKPVEDTWRSIGDIARQIVDGAVEQCKK
jgi:hypothetical protein